MTNQELPIEELKKYGILNPDDTFTKKLTNDEVQSFLEGNILIADNNRNRLVFQLTSNNTSLDVKLFELDKNIDKAVEKSKAETQFIYETKVPKIENVREGDSFKIKDEGNQEFLITSVRKLNEEPDRIYFTDENGEEFNMDFEKLKEVATNFKSEQNVKAIIYDKDRDETVEFDLIKDNTKVINYLEKEKSYQESNKFKVELLKLKGYLQDKIDKFPSIAKDINVNMNIIANTINSIDGIATSQSMEKKQNKSRTELDVNDPDIYQDANRLREEEQREEQNKKRGFRR